MHDDCTAKAFGELTALNVSKHRYTKGRLTSRKRLSRC